MDEDQPKENQEDLKEEEEIKEGEKEEQEKEIKKEKETEKKYIYLPPNTVVPIVRSSEWLK